MNTETSVITIDCPKCGKKPPYCTCNKSQAVSIVPTSGGNFELSATNPTEMVQCHNTAIDWCKKKIAVVVGESKELQDAYEHAKKSKWNWKVLHRHWQLSLKRVEFYKKILAAFEAGYYIVPNFPVTLFAIRTAKPSPKRMWARLKWEGGKNFEQDSQVLPHGKGEYQNPNPLISKSNFQSDQKAGDTWLFYASDWDKLEFPLNMARVHVMEAATRAMDKKIFDEVGFLPRDFKRNPDPLLIGRIIDPRPVGYGTRKAISFIIGWHIDTKNL